jgi:hypothetical protein
MPEEALVLELDLREQLRPDNVLYLVRQRWASGLEVAQLTPQSPLHVTM